MWSEHIKTCTASTGIKRFESLLSFHRLTHLFGPSEPVGTCRNLMVLLLIGCVTVSTTEQQLHLILKTELQNSLDSVFFFTECWTDSCALTCSQQMKLSLRTERFKDIKYWILLSPVLQSSGTMSPDPPWGPIGCRSISPRSHSFLLSSALEMKTFTCELLVCGAVSSWYLERLAVNQTAPEENKNTFNIL